MATQGTIVFGKAVYDRNQLARMISNVQNRPYVGEISSRTKLEAVMRNDAFVGEICAESANEAERLFNVFANVDLAKGDISFCQSR